MSVVGISPRLSCRCPRHPELAEVSTTGSVRLLRCDTVMDLIASRAHRAVVSPSCDRAAAQLARSCREEVAQF